MPWNRVFDLPSLLRRPCREYVILLWIAGIIGGCFFAAGTDPYLFHRMLGERFAVSIVGLQIVIALPFLITAFAVLCSNESLLLSVVFIKALILGFSVFAIESVYGSASWLVRFLLMFGNDASLIPLMWVWLRCFDQKVRIPGRQLLIGYGLAILFGTLDFWLVSPMWAMLI